MRVIFLDIDGVLNSQEWFDSEEYTSNKYIEINGVSCNNEINESFVKNLKDIVEPTGAEIVLCSTWRNIQIYHSPIIYLNYMLNKYGLHIMDKTGKTKPSFRPKEIKEWLDSHDGIESFVILDDDYDYNDYAAFGIEKHLVQTQFYGDNGGLQLRHVERAVKILENDWLWII